MIHFQSSLSYKVNSVSTDGEKIMLNWLKKNVLGNLIAVLLGAALMSFFVFSNGFMGKQVENVGQLWVPPYSISFSLSKRCPSGWRKIGYSVIEVDSSVDSTLRNLVPPSGSDSLYNSLNVTDQSGRTVEGWNLIKLHTCLKEPDDN